MAQHTENEQDERAAEAKARRREIEGCAQLLELLRRHHPERGRP